MSDEHPYGRPGGPPGDDDPDQQKKKKTPKDEKKPSKPKYSFGGLPDNIDDIKPVTTDAGDDVARSVGDVMPATNPFLSGPGFMNAPGPPGGMTLGGPGYNPHGAKTGGPKMGGSSGPRSKTGSATAATGWNITDSSLPVLPPFHPLERSAVFVPNTAAPVVAQRVSDMLRARSIAATFDSVKAKARCLSPENVDFRVRLYRGRGEYSHGVIVEVQRRFGFSVHYHEDVIAILDAAEGKKSVPTAKVTSSFSLIPELEDEAEEETKELMSLSIARDMLTNSRGHQMDSAALCLDSLLSVTDPAKMGQSTSLRASRQIMAGADDTLRNAIIGLLVYSKLPGAGGQHDKTPDPMDVEEYIPALRLTAMSILANVVSVLSTKDPTLLQNQGAFFTQAIVPVVVNEIRSCQVNPRMADSAVRTLCPLVVACRGDVGFISSLREQGAYESLIVAQDAGNTLHAGLARNAGICLSELDRVG